MCRFDGLLWLRYCHAFIPVPEILLSFVAITSEKKGMRNLYSTLWTWNLQFTFWISGGVVRGLWKQDASEQILLGFCTSEVVLECESLVDETLGHFHNCNTQYIYHSDMVILSKVNLCRLESERWLKSEERWNRES